MLFQRSRFLVLTASAVIAFLLIWSREGNRFGDYMYVVFNHAGMGFSYGLSAIFIVGLYVIIDRLIFFVIHFTISGRMVRSFQPDCDTPTTTFSVFLRAARGFRASSAEGVYSDEIIDHAREVALRDTLDGQEVDRGRSLLEFLGATAPMVGFMGTLVGLIGAFRELGFGARLGGVLEGLALAMTSSLLGVMISIIFLSAAWILGRARQTFDARLYRLIATAQETDRWDENPRTPRDSWSQ